MLMANNQKAHEPHHTLKAEDLSNKEILRKTIIKPASWLEIKCAN